MRDEASSDSVSDERGEVGGDNSHLVGEVLLERLAVVVKVDDAGRKVLDVEVVNDRDVGTHGGTRGVEDVARENVVVAEELGQRLENLFRELRLVAEEVDHLGVLVVVRDDPDELGEVPSVPLADAHRERVDILVELVEESDRLNDHVVGSVHVELYFRTRVGVSETELRALRVSLFETGEELLLVETDSSEEFERAVGRIAVNAEGRLDRRRKSTLLNTEGNTGLLGEVEFEEAVKEFVNDTCATGRVSTPASSGRLIE